MKNNPKKEENICKSWISYSICMQKIKNYYYSIIKKTSNEIQKTGKEPRPSNLHSMEKKINKQTKKNTQKTTEQ